MKNFGCSRFTAMDMAERIARRWSERKGVEYRVVSYVSSDGGSFCVTAPDGVVVDSFRWSGV